MNLVNDNLILYEDNHIIVVYKENGLLSQADNSNDLDMLTMIKEYIKQKYNKPGNVYVGLVHRLDRNTRGIMVYSKTSKASRRLSDEIKSNMFKKRYLALIKGIMNDKEGELTNFITKNEREKKSYITNSSKGKIAKLSYCTLYSFSNSSLVDINLETGRFHQIRCQFSNAGHPLIGDYKYGERALPNYEIALQAYSLEFYHPITKELLHFEHIDRNGVFNFLNTIKK